MAATLSRTDVGNIPLGTINSEKNVKDSGIVPVTSVGIDSDQNEVVQYNGASRTIIVRGMYTNAGGVSSIKTEFVDKLETILNGEQDTTCEFTSDLLGTKNVKVASYEYDYKAGDVTSIEYQIILLEAADGI